MEQLIESENIAKQSNPRLHMNVQKANL